MTLTAMKYTIDATNRKVGRVASEAARILMGKDKAVFARNILSDVNVHIENASKLSVGEKKLEQKTYSRYSGYPGGLKKETMKRTVEKKGFVEVIRKAIHGMLPHNKLRPKMMKKLSITE